MSRTKEQAKKDIRKCIWERDYYVRVFDQLERDLYHYASFTIEATATDEVKAEWGKMLIAVKGQVEWRNRIIDGLVDEIGIGGIDE